MKPLFVYVLWSESGKFNEKELLTFDEFEKKAFIAAMSYGDTGYLKTKIDVLFNDGSKYHCRLDLAQNDEHGFMHHCFQMMNRYQAMKDDSCEQDYLAENYIFINKIEWLSA